MTEEEWLACSDPQPMLEFLRGKASDRKLRLFAVACCRRIWHYMLDGRCQAAVEVGELLADGLAGEVQWRAASREAQRAIVEARTTVSMDAADAATSVGDDVIDTAECAAWASAFGTVGETGTRGDANIARVAERGLQATIVRDIFGNPFRPVGFDPSWRTRTAASLSQTMYESRDFSLMPILGDALLDAGCDDEQVLGHCRGGNNHHRGCWVVDSVLGKA